MQDDSPQDRLSETELARLDELLSAPPYGQRGLSIDALQGLCVAMAMGPDAAPPPHWIALVLGDPEGAPAPEELADLLERFRAATARALDAGTLSIAARTTRTGRVDFLPWCSGFLDGVELAETAWFDVADAEELDELLHPIEVLADALPDVREAMKPAQWRERVRDSAQRLDEAVMRLRDYWAIVRAPPATLRREAPKVGRNDPCPCGSGKKFKQCHGKG
jgi:uncharacterized protein